MRPSASACGAYLALSQKGVEMFVNTLDELLASLFEEVGDDEIVVIDTAITLSGIFSACCIHSYAGYNG